MAEARSWMNDKKPTVSLEEYGKDEDTTQSLIKKHEAVALDIETFRTKIQELVTESQRLLSSITIDERSAIAEKQVGVALYCAHQRGGEVDDVFVCVCVCVCVCMLW